MAARGGDEPVQRGADLVVVLVGAFLRHGERELEHAVLDGAQAVGPFEAMVVGLHELEEPVAHVAALGVGARLAAHDVLDLGACVDPGDGVEHGLVVDLAHEDHVGMVLHVGAVLRHEGELLVVAGEVVAQLPVLVAARDHELGADLVHVREDAAKAVHVKAVVAADERPVDVDGNHLDVGHVPPNVSCP